MPGIDKHLRLMLQRYDMQLLAARRLARMRRVQLHVEDATPENVHARRAMMVDKVARELYERILFTDADTPVADTIRIRLGERMGGPLRFAYPPGEAGLTLLREGDAKTLHGEEREQALRALWRITVGAVDESMA